MHLKSLILRQFRNVADLSVEPGQGLNLFVGPNGAGKSNILEAVCVLATSESHRDAEQRHMIQWGKDGLAVLGEFGGEEEPVSVDVRQRTGRPKQVTVNGRVQRRLRDWAGRVPVVAFSPDELFLIKGEPSLRRHLINEILSQTDGDYAEILARYTKLVTERNAALRRIKEGQSSPAILEPWDLSLAKDGVWISLRRQAFVEAFNPPMREEQQRLSSREEPVDLLYNPALRSLEDPVAALEAARRRLRELRDAEIALGQTLVGPHRDDLEFRMHGESARHFSSQGQQRTLALAVKLAERRFLKDKLNREPICLLDDVLSELDPDRRRNLVAALTGQCLVSLTTLADWPEAASKATVFEVNAGTIARPAAAV